MEAVDPLKPGRVLRRAGSSRTIEAAVQIDDPRLAAVLASDAILTCLYEGALHAEAPVWQAARGRLIWSDVSNRRLLAWSPDGRVDVVIDGTSFMNGNAIDHSGRLVHCEHGRRCISRSDGDEEEPKPIVTHFEGKRLNAPNDVTVALDGVIWFTDPTFGILMPSQGSLADPELDHRSVYRFDPENEQLARMADFDQPNGLAFSPDGGTLYVSDTSLSLGEIPGCAAGKHHEVQAFDVGVDGTLSNRRFFCHADHGVPDGLVVDRRGWVWTTAADGVHIWSTDAKRLGFIRTPTIATNCTFGGDNGHRLFITATSLLLAIDLIG